MARVYAVNGRRVPSVTTILGKFKDPTPLMYWAWNTAYTVLKEVDGKDPNEIQGWIARTRPFDRADYKNASEKATSVGTAVHGIIEKWIGGDTGILSWKPNQYVTECGIPLSHAQNVANSLKNFQAWVTTHNLKIVESEIALTHPEYAFGGTIDAIATVKEPGSPMETILLDWKTSKAIYPDYLVQLAAYRLLWNHHNPKRTVRTGHIIRIDKESATIADHMFQDFEAAEDLFLLLREAYELIGKVSKQAGV